MDRRRSERFKRRLQLRFWSLEDRAPKNGFTQNVSLSGMFICTSSPFRPGTRIGIEISTGKDKVQLLGEVRHAERVDPALRQLRPSGMGVRLLKVEELMAEILDLRLALDDEMEEAEEAEQLPSESEGEEPSEASVYPVSFASPRDLVVSFERDIKHGGLFVATPDPAERDAEVTLDFCLDWDPERHIRVPAQVVKRFAAAEGSVAGEKVSGMGVAFTDPAEVIEEFTELIATLEQSSD